jgi:hypothetical protein
MDFDPAAAEAELKQALALDPANAGAYWMEGYVASIEGRFDDALKALERSAAAALHEMQIEPDRDFHANRNAVGPVAWLDRAYRQRDAGMLWIKADPLLQLCGPIRASRSCCTRCI